jgi:HSP20 family protein
MGALMPWRIRELERMNRFFDRMFREWPFSQEIEDEAGGHEAPVECFVRDNSLVVRADVPGMEPKDIDISVLGNVLTIKGERKSKEEEEVKKADYLRREISYGAFERRLTIPEGAQTDKVKAEFKNGVVEITVPLSKEVAARKIPLVEAK